MIEKKKANLKINEMESYFDKIRQKIKRESAAIRIQRWWHKFSSSNLKLLIS